MGNIVNKTFVKKVITATKISLSLTHETWTKLSAIQTHHTSTIAVNNIFEYISLPQSGHLFVDTFQLTHWGRVTHICVSDLTSIGSDNGLSPGRRQAIIRTNAGIWLMEPLGTNFSEILIEIHTFSFKKMHLKMSSAKWRLFCLGLNV